MPLNVSDAMALNTQARKKAVAYSKGAPLGRLKAWKYTGWGTLTMPRRPRLKGSRSTFSSVQWPSCQKLPTSSAPPAGNCGQHGQEQEQYSSIHVCTSCILHVLIVLYGYEYGSAMLCYVYYTLRGASSKRSLSVNRPLRAERLVT